MAKREFKRVGSHATQNEVTIGSCLRGIADEVNADNIAKAMVTVTTLNDDGTFSHTEYNIDNESDLYSRHGVVAEGNFTEAANCFYDISQRTSITTSQTGCEIEVVIGDPDIGAGFIVMEENDG